MSWTKFPALQHILTSSPFICSGFSKPAYALHCTTSTPNSWSSGFANAILNVNAAKRHSSWQWCSSQIQELNLWLETPQQYLQIAGGTLLYWHYMIHYLQKKYKKCLENLLLGPSRPSCVCAKENCNHPQLIFLHGVGLSYQLVDTEICYSQFPGMGFEGFSTHVI
jgi:hypothetical protein